nr:MAG: hypothetical protein 2 [Hangzhou steitz-like virus 5]
MLNTTLALTSPSTMNFDRISPAKAVWRLRTSTPDQPYDFSIPKAIANGTVTDVYTTLVQSLNSSTPGAPDAQIKASLRIQYPTADFSPSDAITQLSVYFALIALVDQDLLLGHS